MNGHILAAPLRRAQRAGNRYWALATGRYGAAVGAGVDEDLAGRMRAEQVRGVLRHTNAAIVATFANSFAVVGMFWSSAPMLHSLGWALMVAAMSAIVIVPRLRSKHKWRAARASSGAIQRIARNALLFGVLWAMVPMLFFADATVGAKVAIVCICAGMIGGGAIVYAGVPTAAIAMISPIALASIWTLARTTGPEASYAIFLTVIFSVVLVRASFLNTLELIRKFASTFETEHLSRRDPLTELDNAATFRGIVTDAVLRLERGEERFAVFIVDLDDLKQVNLMRGHEVGDEVLVEAATRLRKLLRSADRLARIESDQFAILAPGLAGETTARAYATRIAQAFGEQFEINGGRIGISASVGGFLSQSAKIGAVTVMRNAELALRKAQTKGSGSWYVYGPRDDAAALERNALEADLRHALDRHELRLAFQPMLNLVRGQTTGFEALLRWRHPLRGEISPTVFIPIAEEAGLIETFGAWIIREACAAASHWPKDIKVCVNVSAFQLRSMALCDQVKRALAANGMTPDRLEIEVTESVLIGDDLMPIEVLTSLREAGVRLALDDFGTGYSSLSYLRRLPFDRLKIDRSFVMEIATDAGSAAIVKAIISLAGDLGLEVIAEGIETIEQLEMLCALNCAEIQGYLVGKPMSDQDIPAYLANEPAQAAA